MEILFVMFFNLQIYGGNGKRQYFVDVHRNYPDFHARLRLFPLVKKDWKETLRSS